MMVLDGRDPRRKSLSRVKLQGDQRELTVKGETPGDVLTGDKCQGAWSPSGHLRDRPVSVEGAPYPFDLSLRPWLVDQ